MSARCSELMQNSEIQRRRIAGRPKDRHAVRRSHDGNVRSHWSPSEVLPVGACEERTIGGSEHRRSVPEISARSTKQST